MDTVNTMMNRLCWINDKHTLRQQQIYKLKCTVYNPNIFSNLCLI